MADARPPDTDLEWGLWYAASDLSEYAYAASWMVGATTAIDRMLHGHRQRWGMASLDDQETRARLETIRVLIEETGCMPTFSVEDGEQVFNVEARDG